MDLDLSLTIKNRMFSLCYLNYKLDQGSMGSCPKYGVGPPSEKYSDFPKMMQNDGVSGLTRQLDV